MPSSPEHLPESAEPVVQRDSVQEKQRDSVNAMRHRFQLSIKGLGLFTGAMAGISWIVSLPFHHDRVNRVVEEKVNRKGGTVVNKTLTGEDKVIYALKPVSFVKKIYIDNPIFTDTDLQNLGLSQAAELRELSLIGTQITDASIEYLADNTSLEELNISNTRITDAGLKNLHDLRWLRSLRMMDMQSVTDEGMKSVTTHPRLEHLTVGGPGLTDKGIGYLSESLGGKKENRLQSILIARCNATKKELQKLQKASSQCSVITLHDTRWVPPEDRESLTYRLFPNYYHKYYELKAKQKAKAQKENGL